MKIEMKKQYEKKAENKKIDEPAIVKLSKLIISKFEITHLNWFWFRNQLEIEINKQNCLSSFYGRIIREDSFRVDENQDRSISCYFSPYFFITLWMTKIHRQKYINQHM